MGGKPKYAQFTGKSGDWAYEYLEGMCSRCGYVILYDGINNESTDHTIHMGLDEDYKDKTEPHFALARQLALNLFRDSNLKTAVFEAYGLSQNEKKNVTEEMMINSWACAFMSHVWDYEVRQWSK